MFTGPCRHGTAIDQRCQACYLSNYYKAHKDTIKLRSKTWGQNNNHKRKEIVKKSYIRSGEVGRTRRAELALIRYHKDPKGHRQRAKEYRIELRNQFIVAYGSKCECCGETERAFLTLEHTKRNGREHRKRMNSSSQILAELRRLGWPKEEYKLYCFNCNRASWELGICPHQKGEANNV